MLTVGDIDHAWLHEHLGWPLGGEEPISVRSISHSDGVMGSVHEVGCADRWVIFKGPPEDAGARALVAETGLIAREVQSYRFLQARAPSGTKVAPDCLWSTLGPDGRGALALERVGGAVDLSAVMTRGLSRAEAAAAVRALATLHSMLAATNADPLSPPCPWLYSATSAGLVAWVRAGLDSLPRIAAACWPDDVPVGSVQRVLDVDLEAVLAHSHVGANWTSLCHGDAWAGNILFIPAPEPSVELTALLIDWQFSMWGNPLSDVALLLVSSLAPTSRKNWETEILGQYHTTLTAHCDLAYTLEACRDDLRRAEPFAALVALATLEAYTCGMGAREVSGFGARVLAAIERVATAEPEA